MLERLVGEFLKRVHRAFERFEWEDDDAVRRDTDDGSVTSRCGRRGTGING